MGKSGKPNARFLILVVLAVPFSLHAVHRVSAASGGAAADAAVMLDGVAKLKEGVEWSKRITDSAGLVADWLKKRQSSPELPPGLFLFTVTDIKVGGQTVGNGQAIVRTALPMAFLNHEAYVLLRANFPKVDTADTQFGDDQICYQGTMAAHLKTVTLGFPKGADTSNMWYTHSNSKCLAILPWN